MKAASKILKGNRIVGGGRIDGVPVFSAQNLDVAIATPEGTKWCALLLYCISLALVIFPVDVLIS